LKTLLLLLWLFTLGVMETIAQNKPNKMEAYQRDQLANKNLYTDTTGKAFGGLIIGYQGGNSHYLEAGYGYGVLVSKFFFGGMGPSVEFNLKERVNGYKLGIWFNSLFSIGINTILYHNYNKESSYYKKLSFGIRPEIGVGVSVFNVTYGYNALINNTKMSGVNRHLFSIRCMIPFQKK